MELLRRWGQEALDLLYPPVCFVCDQPGDAFCRTCIAAIQPPDPVAALPKSTRDAVCLGAHAGSLRSAVLKLKYSRTDGLAEPLGRLLAERIRGESWAAGFDVVTPVPMHPWRQFWRGYNQSELLAEQVARRVSRPCSLLLRRTRWTPAQVGRSAAERSANLRGSMGVVTGRDVSGLRVLLIDDVRTTGATLGEAAATLRSAGAAGVYAATVTLD